VVQKRNRALILLLLSTGARSSEVLRLDRSEWKSERWWVLGEGDGERIVEVTDKVRAAVEDYLDTRGPLPRFVHWLARTGPPASTGSPSPVRSMCAASSRSSSSACRCLPPPAPAHAGNTAPRDHGRCPVHRRHPRVTAAWGQWCVGRLRSESAEVRLRAGRNALSATIPHSASRPPLLLVEPFALIAVLRSGAGWLGWGVSTVAGGCVAGSVVVLDHDDR
jgi:Phage integrase family